MEKIPERRCTRQGDAYSAPRADCSPERPTSGETIKKQRVVAMYVVPEDSGLQVLVNCREALMPTSALCTLSAAGLLPALGPIVASDVGEPAVEIPPSEQ